MKLYESTLLKTKETQAMVVYGDSRHLRAQYVPKLLFSESGMKKYPETLVFAISIPETQTKLNVSNHTDKKPAPSRLTSSEKPNSKRPPR